MDLEFHQLDLRYEHLRVHQPAHEWRLLASLADIGQQMPIVVVASAGAQVVVDGGRRMQDCAHETNDDAHGLAGALCRLADRGIVSACPAAMPDMPDPSARAAAWIGESSTSATLSPCSRATSATEVSRLMMLTTKATRLQ